MGDPSGAPAPDLFSWRTVLLVCMWCGVCLQLRALTSPWRAGQKEGGQALIGGLDVTVSRNFFGSQIDSFEMHLPAPASFSAVDGCAVVGRTCCFRDSECGRRLTKSEPFRALFIRAPAILSHGPAVEVLAEYVVPDGKAVAETQVRTVAVAVRQGQLLGTAFHPELTADTRWHRLFIDMCAAAPAAAPASGDAGLLTCVPPPPLPVF